MTKWYLSSARVYRALVRPIGIDSNMPLLYELLNFNLFGKLAYYLAV